MTEKTKVGPTLRGQMQPFSAADVQAIRAKLAQKGNARDRALLEVSISTMLRASDLLRLTVADVTGPQGNPADAAVVRQKKTGKAVTAPLSERAQQSIAALITADNLKPGDYLFRSVSNHAKPGAPLTPTAFRTLVKRWADLAGYTDTSRFSGHSTRRTRPAVIYSETKNIEAVRQLLGHSDTASTSRYLGVTGEAALALAKQFEL